MRTIYMILPAIMQTATLITAGQSDQLSKRDDCWTFKNGAYISPRAPPAGCGEGKHALLEAGQTFCYASWVDNDAQGQPVKTCSPGVNDCLGLAKQIEDSTKDAESVLIRWRAGAGQRTPLDFSVKKKDGTCVPISTDFGTCRFDLYVDKAMEGNEVKEFGTLGGDMASAIRAGTKFFPGSNSDKPNSEVEGYLWEGTYTMAKYVVEYPHTNMRYRIYFNHQSGLCKERCGAVEGFCK